MKVVIINSDSFFLNKTADMVSDSVDVMLIQNYTPSKNMVKFLTIFDSVFKTRFRRLQIRRCKSSNVVVHGLLKNDILKAVCHFAAKFGFSMDKLYAYVAKEFGAIAARYLDDAEILHLRTGYGQGGTIEMAKRKNMKVIADHSIACTEEIADILTPEYKKHGISNGIGPQSIFWKLVIDDCRRADVILVNSDYVKKTFVKHGYNPDKIVVNYLGVRDDWFSIKKSYGFSKDYMQILFVGEFGIRKGVEYLLKASQLLNTRGIRYRIVVIGKPADIDDYIKEFDISHFDFVGTVLYDELKKYYSQCDAYLFPSLCEGSTRAGMEAMAAGMPVIFTDNCGCPVEDEVNGLIVPIKDEKAIADAVEKLYNSEELRERLGKNAAMTIANKYTWKHYRDNLLALYNSLVQI